LTIAAADGAKIHPTTARQLLTQPINGFCLLGFIHRNTGQLNGVSAIAISNLKQRSTSHL
jgi:hypothetical protein